MCVCIIVGDFPVLFASTLHPCTWLSLSAVLDGGTEGHVFVGQPGMHPVYVCICVGADTLLYTQLLYHYVCMFVHVCVVFVRK